MNDNRQANARLTWAGSSVQVRRPPSGAVSGFKCGVDLDISEGIREAWDTRCCNILCQNPGCAGEPGIDAHECQCTSDRPAAEVRATAVLSSRFDRVRACRARWAVCSGRAAWFVVDCMPVRVPRSLGRLRCSHRAILHGAVGWRGRRRATSGADARGSNPERLAEPNTPVMAAKVAISATFCALPLGARIGSVRDHDIQIDKPCTDLLDLQRGYRRILPRVWFTPGTGSRQAPPSQFFHNNLVCAGRFFSCEN